jgi:hypothetical protein
MKQYEWTSVHVLVPLILGFVILVAFCFWEVYGASHPIFPTRLKQETRTLGLTLVITFISGCNFFSVLMFWPTQSFNVYGHDPVDVGVRSLPIGFGILGGACIILWLLSVLRGHNKELLVLSSVFMTAGMLSSHTIPASQSSPSSRTNKRNQAAVHSRSPALTTSTKHGVR